jgi:hypothetical protein
VNATIVGLILNIRDNVLTAGQTVTATIFTSPCGFAAPTTTGITATVTGPNALATPNCVATGTGSVPVTQGTLVSVQITASTGVGALASGVAVTVYISIP